MHITYIIPTLRRKTLHRAVSSILNEDCNSTIIVEDGGNSAGGNRNMALSKVCGKTDWIMFLDDDDFLSEGYKAEFDNDYDIIVFTMEQHGRVIPHRDDQTLRYGNVGINFAIKKELYDRKKVLFENGHGEDWKFIKQYIPIAKKIKITDKVYYQAPISSNNKRD